jgi:hypothetical protein
LLAIASVADRYLSINMFNDLNLLHASVGASLFSTAGSSEIFVSEFKSALSFDVGVAIVVELPKLVSVFSFCCEEVQLIRNKKATYIEHFKMILIGSNFIVLII